MSMTVLTMHRKLSLSRIHAPPSVVPRLLQRVVSRRACQVLMGGGGAVEREQTRERDKTMLRGKLVLSFTSPMVGLYRYIP